MGEYVFPLAELKRFEGYEYQTLDQANPFTLSRVEDWGVYYVRRSGSHGFIRPKTLHRVWWCLTSGAELDLPGIQQIITWADPHRTKTDQSCLAAVVASLREVRHYRHPVRLVLNRFAAELGQSYVPQRPATVASDRIRRPIRIRIGPAN